MLKHIEDVREDVRRLMPYTSFTEEERMLLNSMVGLLDRVEKKRMRIDPKRSRKTYTDHARMLDFNTKICSMIYDMLSDAEKKWNADNHKKFKRHVLKSHIERMLKK